MDRHPQQIKRERQDIKRRERNVANMSRLRTLIKNVLESTDKASAESHYGKAVSVIDKSIKIGLIHKNTGARRKSQVTRHLNSLN
ncbi:MAG: 30S ribosomal protein S20 [Candidatus Marinimicrobia bacterium]|jgi:small subunit ribosomal protein S20|nr:30S ribosomal protein S20 [Candidatus Neomarinimicrobiota bacterium]MBT3691889.1 30S ribosomal protein S20 [Candidatus Neomarinimicrobiota bacterium]MBT3732559.1 30S ribosomal protein S20 [Candidatus Neomarinimicrobiota bacterium]MBT4144115.1 30S ribosomal protein S20 [Candidatus Neomarinimicrobiota bacterium]MBT4178403.1 30S ribosomal protein S20 [Candidatus Neomarinimicrobiota bacterium]